MSPIHQVQPKPSCKAQWKGEEGKTDRGRGGKTTSGNGQAWSSAGHRGQWRTGKNGGNGCKIICGAPVTLAVTGIMMMMMMTWKLRDLRSRVQHVWRGAVDVKVARGEAVDTGLLLSQRAMGSSSSVVFVDVTGRVQCLRWITSNSGVALHQMLVLSS